MIEAQLSKRNFDKTIVTLNANIVEYFQAMNHDNSRSVHVGHIASIEITSNQQGKHALLIKTYGGKAARQGKGTCRGSATRNAISYFVFVSDIQE